MQGVSRNIYNNAEEGNNGMTFNSNHVNLVINELYIKLLINIYKHAHPEILLPYHQMFPICLQENRATAFIYTEI